MARYVTSGAQYNPFDFNAMWKSAEYATQAHHAQAAQFAALAEQISPLETMKYNPVDANDYQQVQQYNQQLNDALSKFQKQGLSGGSFQNFLQLSKDYSSKIKPLELGLQQRKAYDALNSQIVANDQTAVIVKKGSDIPLSEFIKGGVTPQAVSGARVQQQVAAITSKIAQQFNGKIDVQSINKYFDLYLSQAGYKLDDVLNFMQNPYAVNEKNQMLNTIIEGVLHSTQGFDALDANGQAYIREQARQGAWGAVGNTTPSMQSSMYFENRRDQREQEANARAWNADAREQAKFDIEMDFIKAKTDQAQANADFKNRTGATPVAGPAKSFNVPLDAKTIARNKELKDEYDQYIKDKANGKNPKQPKLMRDLRMTSDQQYGDYLKQNYSSNAYQKTSITPNSTAEFTNFASSMSQPVYTSFPEVRRNNNSTKKSLAEWIEIDPKKYKSFAAYAIDNFEYSIDPRKGAANGLQIYDRKEGNTYYMPYSAFGTATSNLIKENLKAIEYAKTDSRYGNNESLRDSDISTMYMNILNIIYSTTLNPNK